MLESSPALELLAALPQRHQVNHLFLQIQVGGGPTSWGAYKFLWVLIITWLYFCEYLSSTFQKGFFHIFTRQSTRLQEHQLCNNIQYFMVKTIRH